MCVIFSRINDFIKCMKFVSIFILFYMLDIYTAENVFYVYGVENANPLIEFIYNLRNQNGRQLTLVRRLGEFWCHMGVQAYSFSYFWFSFVWSFIGKQELLKLPYVNSFHLLCVLTLIPQPWSLFHFISHFLFLTHCWD